MNDFLKSIACSGMECLSWILVLINILAVLYLVFCSFWKVTRVVKIAGWVWAACLITATIGVLIAHTCVYTLLTTIFTAMIMMAILAIILPLPKAEQPKESKEKKIKLGCYVISKTDDERYAFAIYDWSKKLVVKSRYSYMTLDAVKSHIFICQSNGHKAAIHDRTNVWIQEAEHPFFDMYSEEKAYRYSLEIHDEYTMFISDPYENQRLCLKMLKKAKAMVISTEVYLNTEKINGADYLHFGESEQEKPTPIVSMLPVPEEEIKPEPAPVVLTLPVPEEEIKLEPTPIVLMLPVPEEKIEPEPIIEEVEELSGVEVIGVVWPEKSRVYRYDPNGEKLDVGDVVLVPSRDEARHRDIERNASVAEANYRIEPEELKFPLKKIIRVVKRKSEAVTENIEKQNIDMGSDIKLDQNEEK